MILGKRELAIYRLIQDFRLLTRPQIQELVFPGLSSKPCTRALQRLEDNHLIVRFNLRRPGKRGGAELIYKAVGKRVLGIPDHTLAVGDIYLTLVGLERQGWFTLESYEVEPRHDGLNPDLNIQLTDTQARQLDYEVDLNTEGLNQVRGKLRAVVKAYHEATSGFPLTVWACIDRKRMDAIARLIRELPEVVNYQLADDSWTSYNPRELFAVTTFDELEHNYRGQAVYNS